MTKQTKQQQIDALQHLLTSQRAGLSDTIGALLGEVQQRNAVLAQYRRVHGVTCGCETCRIAEVLIHTPPALHSPAMLAAQGVTVTPDGPEQESETHQPLIPFQPLPVFPFQPLPGTVAPAPVRASSGYEFFTRQLLQAQAAGLSADDTAQLQELEALQRDGGGGVYRIEDDE